MEEKDLESFKEKLSLEELKVVSGGYDYQGVVLTDAEKAAIQAGRDAVESAKIRYENGECTLEYFYEVVFKADNLERKILWLHGIRNIVEPQW